MFPRKMSSPIPWLPEESPSFSLTYLPDALGSTLVLADSCEGTSTTYTYAPSGETSVSGLPSASPFQFTGRENDGTGLYYYRARYYDPVRIRLPGPSAYSCYPRH